MAESILATEEGRRRALDAALILTENTRWAPPAYERELMERFVRGELTLDEVEACLESPLSSGKPT